MTRSEDILLLVLGALALVWLGLALYVLLTRLLFDAGARIVQGARSILERGLSEALSGEAVDLDRLLRRLRRKTIERVAADTATPEHVASAFALRAVELYPSRIMRSARSTSRRRRWNRITALRILARARWAVALPLLEEALESGDEEVVAAAVATLGQMRVPRAAALLIRALKTDLFARSRIAAQLDTFPEPIPDLLVPLLRDLEPQLRYWAATLLGRYAGDTAVDLELAAATGDLDPAVRAAAVESLAVGGSPAAIGGALALVNDPVWFVRAHAAKALGTFHRDDLSAAVAPLLADEAWWVRGAAKETLEDRPAMALQIVVQYLEHEDEFARNGAANVLQNTGALDALVVRAIEDPSDDDLRMLRRILSAGGPRIVASAAARGGVEAELLIQELAAAAAR